jgi:LacI family transcriptional regulator
VAGPQHTSTGYHRARTFVEFMKEHDLQSDLIESASKFTVEEGQQAFRRLLARDNNFTAVVAGNDLLALGCMDAMNGAGIVVPDNMSITGYDDMLFLGRMSPALTTIHVPKYDMGSLACKTLLELIGGEELTPSVSKIQPQLVVRNSTTTAPR